MNCPYEKDEGGAASSATQRRLRCSPPALALRFVLALTLVLLAALAPFSANRVLDALRFPYQLDAEEGHILNQALRLRRGEPLYPPIDEPPYVVDNYTPLYPLAWSWFVDPEAPSLQAGRTLCALAALAVALALALAVLAARRPGASPTPRLLLAAVAPLLFLTSRSLLRWAAYTRVDLFAVAFSVAGVAVFAWGERSRGRRVLLWRAAALALFLLAFLSKQTALVAPAACGLFLLLKNRRSGGIFSIAFLALLAGTFGLLQAISGGGFFRHGFLYNVNVMHWNELAGWGRHLLLLYAPLLFGAALLALCFAPELFSAARPLLRLRTPQTGEITLETGLFLPYALLNGVALLGICKAGAAENYLLEPVAAAALFFCAATARLAEQNERRPAGRTRLRNGLTTACAAGALLFHAVRFTAPPHWWPAQQPFLGIEASLADAAPQPTLQAFTAGRRIVRTMRETPGDVLSEDPIYALIAGKPVLLQHFIMTELAREGRWNDAPFVERLRRREISLIVAHSDLFDEGAWFSRYTGDMLEAVRANYRLAELIERGRRRGLEPLFLLHPATPEPAAP